MVISVRHIVAGCDTNDEGAQIYSAIASNLRVGGSAIVSFAGIQNATSSFVNSAFVELLNDMSLDDIKKQVRIVDASRQIREIIKRRLTAEAEKASLQVA